MAWTAPRTWVTGEVVTAAQLNEQLRDNERYLKGLDGGVTIEDRLTLDGDASFYLEIDGSSKPRLNLDSTDWITYDRVNDEFEIGIGGAEQAKFSVNGLRLASGNYINYDGSYYPVVTDEGTQKVMVWGQQAVSWDGSNDTDQNVATGLTTVETFVFTAESSSGDISNVKIDSISGGTVTTTSKNNTTTSGQLHWIATGV